MDYQIEKDQTTDDVLGDMDLTGKRVLLTGAGAGLGLETCRAMAVRGAEVIGAVRDPDKARAAIAQLAGDASGSVELVKLDLASLQSVRQCADALLAKGAPFDVIICNAGVMATPQGKTSDGHETQLGINHLGHFLLVNLLVPLLRSGSRVIILSSMAHRLADIDLDDPNFERRSYDAWMAYGAAKTANVLFTVELDKRLRDRGVRVAAVHPGVVTDTALTRHMSREDYSAFVNAERDIHHRNKSIPEGAATTVWAAFVAPADDVGGRYSQDCQLFDVNDSQVVSNHGPRAYALDPDRAARLWTISEQMVGQSFDFA
ncbi:SDR family NAD(P)-dependent oxidoreductase [Sphingobium sp. AN641]|uniref:SDR family NAD(P)-dependent oxidoreductase n=1 Tax=Sphingobium sp. AN641 TaxID=3133443 RepID=UPI0030C5C95E